SFCYKLTAFMGFRNSGLIKYPDVAAQYLNLKRELAEICSDRQTYTLRKAPFIQNVIALAKEEFNRNGI
ncbi:GrpB family protein, partial [Paenibacillus sp. 3LSP]|uniref:GrpB family protein n=1 Tax=Paenibacillus sp. 3LSP TaxID=2800795 RepID=UPI0028FD610B